MFIYSLHVYMFVCKNRMVDEVQLMCLFSHESFLRKISATCFGSRHACPLWRQQKTGQTYLPTRSTWHTNHNFCLVNASLQLTIRLLLVFRAWRHVPIKRGKASEYVVHAYVLLFRLWIYQPMRKKAHWPMPNSPSVPQCLALFARYVN